MGVFVHLGIVGKQASRRRRLHDPARKSDFFASVPPRAVHTVAVLIQPYIGKINDTAILNCVKGSLHFAKRAPTVITPNMDGSISQSLGLAFAFNPDASGATITGMDWNNQPAIPGWFRLWNP